MVGNDIIDIKETKHSTNWERPGFLQKIFTQKEQSIIAVSDNPFNTVWNLWSMKESAYKVFIQSGGDRFYNPKKMVCGLKNLEKGQVNINGIILNTLTSLTSDYIFSIATINNSQLKNSIFELQEKDIQQQSDFVRKQLIKDFSNINHLNSNDLEIRKTEAGVPLLYYKNELLTTSISITHHGKYAAYSFLKDKNLKFR